MWVCSLPLWNHYSWTFTLSMSFAPTSILTDSKLWRKRVWADTQKLQILILSICNIWVSGLSAGDHLNVPSISTRHQFVCRLFYLLQLKIDHFISINRFLKIFLCLSHKRQRLNMNILKTVKDKSSGWTCGLRQHFDALWFRRFASDFSSLVCLRGLTHLLTAARLQNTWNRPAPRSIVWDSRIFLARLWH